MSWFGDIWQRLCPPIESECDKLPAADYSALREGVARLVLGLGNPGKEYAATRHNIGYMAMDELARRHQAVFGHDAGAEALVAVIPCGGALLALAKPLTYMNLSGRSAAKLAERWGIPAEKCLAVVDDFHLPLGKLRMRPSGSSGGHNGLKSLAACLGGEGFPRLRVGIAPAAGQGAGAGEVPVNGKGSAADFVLSPFAPEELGLAERMAAKAADAVEDWAAKGVEWCQGRHNG